MSFKNINWLELLLPVWKDIQVISDETSSYKLIKNNEELQDDPELYAQVIEALNEK